MTLAIHFNSYSLGLHRAQNTQLKDRGQQTAAPVLSLRSLWSSNGCGHAYEPYEPSKKNRIKNETEVHLKKCGKTEEGRNNSNCRTGRIFSKGRKLIGF